MGLGILEDKKMAMPPGTALFSDDPNAAAKAAYAGFDLSKLKHVNTGKHTDIILVPQPSDDPNDPLNWPKWRKWAFYATTFYGTVIVGVYGPLVAADQPGIAAAFGTDVQGISRILGSYLTLTLAISTVIMQPIAAKIGKRPIYLFTSVLLIVSAFGSAYCDDIGPYTATRILGAIGMAPLEFLVGSSIADIFYLHERGWPIALWNVALLEGINLTPPIAGQILAAPGYGWRWCYILYGVACIPLLIAQILFMPESKYIRHVKLPSLEGEDEKEKAETDYVERADSPVYGPKKTFVQELKPWSKIYPTRNNIFFLFAQPFILLFTPGLLYGGLVYGERSSSAFDAAATMSDHCFSLVSFSSLFCATSPAPLSPPSSLIHLTSDVILLLSGMGITWLVLLATAFAFLFGAEPYNFNASQSGLIYMSPFIFCAIAVVMVSYLTDWLARTMSKRNGGIYEPEFKLLPVIVYMVVGGGGLFGFGYSLEAQAHWIVPVLMFGFVQFGLTFGTSGIVSYIIDLHRNQSDAAVAALIFWKNIYSFALTWNIVDWILENGVGPTFAWVGGCTVGFCALTPLMYIFGKRLRSACFRLIPFEGEESAAH